MKQKKMEGIYLDLVEKALGSKHGLDVYAVLIKGSFTLEKITEILKKETSQRNHDHHPTRYRSTCSSVISGKKMFTISNPRVNHKDSG